ncbi:hypothetical protein HALO59_150454 [Halomonas sp. 59]|nr:hypothetical protein HALO59_150454 [Halomonas sp. 59]CAD5260511.1 hypothetical protein HALO113_160456 [Halomonas sp. 113]CAD5274494.1 hypothetical protein HALOI3_200455 [Halomonas sp. I3]CAD5288154.1 hypothetical protein HALO156_40186 [Halomonas sp. 156]VXB39557.1 hypothetical protein HALO98_160451 [Halomonas titanicae]
MSFHILNLLATSCIEYGTGSQNDASTYEILLALDQFIMLLWRTRYNFTLVIALSSPKIHPH